MSNQSIIEHRANYYYVEFREELLIIALNCSYKKAGTAKTKCKASPYCKALILAILEGWTNDKRGRGSDLSVYMTYPQWTDAMYGLFRRSTIIDSIDELLGEGLVTRSPHRIYDRDTYKYLLNHKELNRRLRALPERDPNEKHPQVNWSQPIIDPSTNKPVPSTSRRVASTSKPDTRLLVDDDPSTSRHNIESTKNLNLTSSKCVSPASKSSQETIEHTPKQNDSNPLMPEIPETPMPIANIAPLIPFEKLPWGAEKVLRLTESTVKTTYNSDAGQLRACQKILDTYNPTEEDYKGVVEKADAYYRRHKQTLYPTNLLAIDKSSGRVWFDRLYEEVRRFSQAVPAEDNDYKVHTSPLVLQEETLPESYIVEIEKLGYDFGCSDYIQDTTNSLLLVYRDASPEWFEEVFTRCLTEADRLTTDQVRAMRFEDHLDYLCRAIQLQFKNSQNPVIESN